MTKSVLGSTTQNDLGPILIAGGHEDVLGGLEIFIARARTCLGITAHQATETPGYGGMRLGRYMHSLVRFVRSLPAHKIVWLQYGSAFDLAYLVLAKLFGRKVAVTPHLGGSWRSIQNRVFRTLCNRLLGIADVIFTLHQTQPASLGFPASLVKRCRVMPTFLPETLTQEHAPVRSRGKPLRLIHAARLSTEKGSFAFLDVCAALTRRGVVYEACIVGTGDGEVNAALPEEIKQRGLTVSQMGVLPQSAFFDLLRSQDVLVNLSLQDAYPLTVLEALLCGVAPVCSALPGAEEMAGEAPAISLVQGQNAEAAADKILAIDWPSLPDSAEVIRRKFDWSVLGKQYHAAFSELIAPSYSANAAMKAVTP